jgi:hypothetical protein
VLPSVLRERQGLRITVQGVGHVMRHFGGNGRSGRIGSILAGARRDIFPLAASRARRYEGLTLPQFSNNRLKAANLPTTPGEA